MNVHVDVASDLASAMVVSCGIPTLLLDSNLTIRRASNSFCEAFEIRPDLVEERELSELGGGEWDLPKLNSLLRTIASGHARVDCYELDLKPKGRDTRRLLLKIARLQGGSDREVSLLLSILDQTEMHASARLIEDLSHENERLRQQQQMRIANSLQIIASVLLNAAQHVRSSGLRGQDDGPRQRDRHTDELTRHLSLTASGSVEMHTYLTQLCHCLRNCMIPDSRHVVVEVRVDSVSLPAAEATSIGLMVTELVINAVRHAVFNPNFGQIVVSFATDADDGWRLMVKDNGHAAPASRSQPGLGTGIVVALARQLGGEHTRTCDGTGTTALVVRKARTASSASATA